MASNVKEFSLLRDHMNPVEILDQSYEKSLKAQASFYETPAVLTMTPF